MNFELIDNFMQVGVMLVAAVADIIFWFRQRRSDLYYSGAGTWLFYDGDFVLCVIPLHSR